MRISLDSAVTETFGINDFLNFLKIFNISATKQNIDKFVAIDDKSSHVFQEAILE